jgi:hypothetical protein
MASELSHLITSAELLDQGVLYKYDVVGRAPQLKGWGGFFVAYATSSVGYRTNLSVFLEHATLIFSNLSTQEDTLKLSLAIQDKSSDEVERIKMVAKQTLTVCLRYKHDPKIQLIAESIQRITSIELMKREFLVRATKLPVLIADKDAEVAFLNCLRFGDDTLESQREKYIEQFSLDVNRMGWSFEKEDGSIEEFPIQNGLELEPVEREEGLIEHKLKEILLANQNALGPLDDALDVEVQLESKLNRIKQFCHQALGSLLGGMPIPPPLAAESYNEINSHLIFSKLFNLKMELPEERAFWIVKLKNLNFNVSKDLSKITFSGLWKVSLNQFHHDDPIASIKASITLDFSLDQLILKPAFDPVVSDHATIKDLEDLVLWLC